MIEVKKTMPYICTIQSAKDMLSLPNSISLRWNWDGVIVVAVQSTVDAVDSPVPPWDIPLTSKADWCLFLVHDFHSLCLVLFI